MRIIYVLFFIVILIAQMVAVASMEPMGMKMFVCLMLTGISCIIGIGAGKEEK